MCGRGDDDYIRRARQRERLKEKRGRDWVIEEGGRQESLLKEMRRLEEKMRSERGEKEERKWMGRMTKRAGSVLEGAGSC